MACRSRPGRTGLPLVVLVLLAARAQAVNVQIDSTTYTGGKFYVDDGTEIAKVRWTRTAADTGWVLESQSANSTAWFAVLTVAAGSPDVTGTDFHPLDIVPGEACQACPDGFTSLLGGHSADDCVCPEGTYQDSGACAACPATKTSPFNSTSIDACVCDAGHTLAADGETCELCSTTKHKPNSGDDACTACPAASSAIDDRTRCQCGDGYYGNLAPMQRFRFVLLETSDDPTTGWSGLAVSPADFFLHNFRVDVDDVYVSIMCESKIADALPNWIIGVMDMQSVENTNIFCEPLPTDIAYYIFYVGGSSENFDGVVFEFNLTDSRLGFTYRFDDKPPDITINQNTGIVYPISWRIEGLDPVEDEWVTVHEVRRAYTRPQNGFTTGGCQSCGQFSTSALPRETIDYCTCEGSSLLAYYALADDAQLDQGNATHFGNFTESEGYYIFYSGTSLYIQDASSPLLTLDLASWDQANAVFQDAWTISLWVRFNDVTVTSLTQLLTLKLSEDVNNYMSWGYMRQQIHLYNYYYDELGTSTNMFGGLSHLSYADNANKWLFLTVTADIIANGQANYTAYLYRQ